jgi:CheY-like chemotaxis protein
VTGTANLPSNQTEIRSRLAIILDIESRDWDFTIQAGALRRVVMNIFGNAQKYTDSGYILVRLRVQDGNGETPSGKFLRLNIRDSGRGMSSEYMERKLYHPFAQEDSFATGVGLGLSIVWSIVNQLGGKIHVRSELGKGTDVEVTLPLEKAGEPQGLSVDAADSVYASVDGTRTLETLRQRATGKSVSIFRNSKPGAPHKDVFWGCISRYCRDWYGFDIKPSGGHIIITDEHDMDKLDQYGKIMVVHKSMVCSKRDATQHRVIDICSPVGPFKLAKTLLELLDRDEGPFASHRTDAGTQTPAGSPEERKILNGLILTDYGFPRQSLPEVLAASAEKVDTEGVSLSKPPTNHFIERSLSTSLKLPLRLTKSASDSKLRQSAAITTPQPPISRQESTTLHPLSSLSSDTTPKHIPEDISRSHPPKQDPSPTVGLHILAVDDNAVNLQLLQRYLQKRKHDTIITARNGFEAVEAYKAALSNTELHLQTFDVVFMDISMPGMDGFEATRVIRKLETEQAAADKEASLSDEEIGKRRAYVVALTGLASSRDRHEAVESGLDDFFTKPVSFKKIGELLGRLERMAQGNKRGE